MKNIKNFLGAFIALLLISCCTMALPSCQTHTDSKQTATVSSFADNYVLVILDSAPASQEIIRTGFRTKSSLKAMQSPANKPATPVKLDTGHKRYSSTLRLNMSQCLSCHNSMPEYNLCLNKQSLTLSPIGDPWYSQSEIGSMLPYFSSQLSYTADAMNRYEYSLSGILYSSNSPGRARSEGPYSDILLSFNQ